MFLNKRPILLSIFTILLIAGCSPNPGSMVADTSRAEAAFEETPIEASLNLVQVDDDRVPVQVDPGAFSEDTVLFRLPRVVQGTYAISNFGSFVDNLVAIDYDGNTMEIVQQDVNTWAIGNADQLDYIRYLVNDTFDIEQTDTATPFSPSGTNISPGNFVLNLHGFVGYFEGRTEHPYRVAVTAPEGMAKNSALTLTESTVQEETSTVTDIYMAERYFQVTDNPMFYGNITTETFPVDDISVTLSLYSPDGAHTAGQYRDAVSEMMQAQKNYIGDNIPTPDRYNIYLYMSTPENDATGYGALEHHTSTVVVLPEYLDSMRVVDALVDVVSHEFFHIIAPLSVHSQHIHYFDYYDPVFSKHLWMYEGLTEYFASHFQIYEDLESEEDFYEKMAEKIEYSLTLDDSMSFTEMSENVIEEPYQTNYINVYQKGAMFGLCMDIILREQSSGERSMISLMRELSNIYGVEHPFDEDSIIQEITSMTYPEMGDFIQNHIVEGVPIDYNDYLNKVGLELGEEEMETTLFFIDEEVPFIDAIPATGEVFFRDIELNSSLQALGVQPGDTLHSINGMVYNLNNIGMVLGPSFSWGPDQEITMGLIRDGEEITVSGTVGTPTLPVLRIREMEQVTEEQQQLRDWWLGNAMNN